MLEFPKTRMTFPMGIVLLLCLGCDRIEVEPIASPEIVVVEPEVSDADLPIPSEATTWISKDQLPWDAWYLQYVGGKQIGYYHVEVKMGERLLQIKRTAVFEFGKPTPALTAVEVEALEYPDGKLASFEERTTVADSLSLISGQVINDKLNILSTNASGKTRTTLNWLPGTWGVLEIQPLLLQSPMQAGEKRTARIFLPKLKKIVDVQLTAEEPEVTALPGGKTQELLPIEVTMFSGNTSTRSKNWIAPNGEILKTVTLDGTMASTFRAASDVGIRVADKYKLRSLLGKTTPFTGAAPDRDAKSASYIAEGTNLNLYSIWSKNVRQRIKSLSALSSRISILDLEAEEKDNQPDQPSPECSLPNDLIQSEHPAIDSLAKKLVEDLQSPRDIAIRLTQSVHEFVTPTEFSDSVGSALETLRTHQGDCTETSLLLVALLRNRGIPARVACGLKLNRKSSTFQFHMWSEAWVQDRWLPFDGTTGGLTGVDCLKMSDTAMSDPNPFPPILSVFEKMDRMTIRYERDN